MLLIAEARPTSWVGITDMPAVIAGIMAMPMPRPRKAIQAAIVVEGVCRERRCMR